MIRSTREHSTVCRLRQGNWHAHTSLNTCMHDRIREIARTCVWSTAAFIRESVDFNFCLCSYSSCIPLYIYIHSSIPAYTRAYTCLYTPASTLVRYAATGAHIPLMSDLAFGSSTAQRRDKSALRWHTFLCLLRSRTC